MSTSSDGCAVVAARTLLAGQGVPQVEPWRSTVVRREDGSWVVRTWIRTPPHLSRPSGTPDYVHAVSNHTGHEQDRQVQQVHPPLP